MKNCPQCKKELPDYIKYCNHCGVKQPKCENYSAFIISLISLVLCAIAFNYYMVGIAMASSIAAIILHFFYPYKRFKNLELVISVSAFLGALVWLLFIVL